MTERTAVDAITPDLFEVEGTVLITKWVVIAEFVRPDGTRSLTRQWSDSCAPWDVEMLLAAGQSQEWRG